MSISFPSSPYIGQITTTGSNTWRWDGVKWSIVSSVGFQGSSGFQGTVGFQGSTGFQSSLGFQGSFGFQGSAGFQGTVGFQGSTGFQSSVGFQGSPGFQGTVGFQGSFGFQGSPGFQGSYGFQGCVGFQGSLAIANVAVADTPPPFANNGYLWLDTSSGNLNIYYGPNNVWISVTSVGIQGTPGFKGSAGAPNLTTSSYISQGFLNADQTISNGSDNIVQFIADLDPLNWWNASTYKLTPTVPGYYDIKYGAWWSAASSNTGQINTQIRKNGNSITLEQSPRNTTTGFSQQASKLVYLNGTSDYIDFSAYCSFTDLTLYKGNSLGSGTWYSAALMTNGSSGYTGSTGIGYTGSIGTTLPLNNQSATYVLQTSDNGSVVSATANVTVNAGVFSNGQNVTIFNNTPANVNIIANTGVTFYLAGSSSTGNRILQTRGVSTLICVNVNTFVATGAGLV
jgi:Collagen triple helix repeat (20 copies)